MRRQPPQHDGPEHPSVMRPQAFMRRPVSAWLISFLGVFLGIWLALAEDRIRQTTWAALHNLVALRVVGPVIVDTIVFWVACVCWAMLLYQRLRIDDDIVEQRTLAIVRAIHKAPNLRVVSRYPSVYFQRVIQELGPLAPAQPLGSAGEVAQRIRQALATVARLAQDFSRAPDASYGANVMLVAGPAEFDALRPRLRFVLDVRETSSLRAILYLLPELLVPDAEQNAERTIPPIALPVAEKARSNGGHRLVLPGAPSALLTGEPSVYMDTCTLWHDCEDLAKPVIEQIRQYFSEQGEGRHVRSFASFRLGNDKNPVGVLNIDSNCACVLGESEEYYSTFFALLDPILAALAVQVREYAKLAGPPATSS